MSSLTLVRRIAARPSIVFEAMTTADGIGAWWGPDDLPVVRAESDARVGGEFRVRFRTADRREHEASGEFLELVAPRRIVMSWRWTSGGEEDERERTSRVEVDLAPVPDGTLVTFTHEDLANDASAKSHTWGWSGAFDKLVRHVERRARAHVEPVTEGGARR
jgi:uncharacterized protein YndB with AHSA1/START domain